VGIVIPLDEKKDAGLDSLLELISPTWSAPIS
jgi:hypothetical protein